MHLGQGYEVHVLPDAVNVISPHGSGGDDAASYRRVVFKQLLAADAYQNLNRLSRLYTVRDVDAEREEQVEVLSYFLLIDIHLCQARYGFKIDFDLLSFPIGRNGDCFPHPCHLHLFPFLGIGGVIAVVGTFEITIGKRVDVPGRRDFDACCTPRTGCSRQGQCRCLALPLPVCRGKCDRQKVPIAVQANLFAIRFLHFVDDSFAGSVRVGV